MILWSAALAAFLLLAAWGAANWKVFHLAYYKHCARRDRYDIIAFDELVRVHLRKGMTKNETRNLLGAFSYDDRGDEVFVVCTYGHVVLLVFENGHLIEWKAD